MKTYIDIKIKEFAFGLKLQMLNLINSTFFSSVISPIIYAILTMLGYIKKVVTYDSAIFFAVFFLVSIDTIVGIRKWIILKKFNDKKVVVGAFEKMFLCLCVMTVFNIFTMRLEGHDDLQSYMKLFSFLIVLSYPTGSIFKNVFFITKGKYPPIGFMRKWENYEDTADIDQIFKKEVEKANTVEPPKE